MAYGQYQILDNKNLIGIWDEMYEPALGGVWATKIGVMQGSDMGVESYAWLGAAPSLEELTDDSATEEQFGKYSYFLKNREFQKTLKIKETDMRRDKIGQIQLRIGEMSEKAAEHWNVLAAAALLAGSTSAGIGYDGQQFFSATHNEAVAAGGPTQSNLLTSSTLPALDVVTPTAPTPYEAAQIINQAIGYFYSLVDDKNYPMNGQAKSFKVLVGTISIYAPFLQATTLLTFAQGTQNPLIGLKMNGQAVQIEVELIPQLSTFTTGFYILRTDGRVKALILQSEVDVEPMVSDRSNDEFIKFRRFLFSIYASRAVGYLRWQSALKCTMN
jgi:phage major head subunit gpT-like protein